MLEAALATAYARNASLRNFLALVPYRWHNGSMKAVVAMSGGVDSLFALLFLREQGYEVTAIHARFLPDPASDAVPALQRLCGSLGVPLVVADCTQSFRTQVMEPFAEAHVQARTPNPCALCNRAMKFGMLMDTALEHGDVYVTGHYAAMAEHADCGPTLRAGADTAKEQSYFLALVPAERLRRCLFPLADKKKADVRAWLCEHGVEPPIPVESQEICFVPGKSHYVWLERWSRQTGMALPGPGPMVLANERKIIAEHRGLWNYTEGQRRGLGVAWKEPLYVLRRMRESNTLLVGTGDMLPVSSCSARQVNFMVPHELWPEEIFVRTRYHQHPAAARVSVCGNAMTITFAQPQLPPAPGQIAAVYDREGFVLAGGVLS